MGRIGLICRDEQHFGYLFEAVVAGVFADSGVGVVPVVLGEVAGVAVAVAQVREVGNAGTGAEGHFGDGIAFLNVHPEGESNDAAAVGIALQQSGIFVDELFPVAGDGICADVLANLDYEDVGLLHHRIGKFVVPRERTEVELSLEFRNVGDRIADAHRVPLTYHPHQPVDIVLVDAGCSHSSSVSFHKAFDKTYFVTSQTVAKEEDADRRIASRDYERIVEHFEFFVVECQQARVRRLLRH